MKGYVFVGLYSVVLIGLFAVFCYLMTIVNPDPILEEKKSRRQGVNGKDATYTQTQKYIIGYGLEKIPEGIDADEFRRTTAAIFYDHGVGRASVEHGQKVVPPVWPSDRNTENDKDAKENIRKPPNRLKNNSVFETSSSVKGLRRSVDDKNPGSVLLKIINNSGQNKIEIKFVSTENYFSKELRTDTISNKLNNNKTFDLFVELNQSSTTEEPKDNSVVEIKSNDIVILTVVDNFDRAVKFDESFKKNILITNFTNILDIDSYFNKTINDTNIAGKHGEEMKLKKKFNDKETYTFNLLSNSINRL